MPMGHPRGAIALSLQRGHAFMKGHRERMLREADNELRSLRQMDPRFKELCKAAKDSAETYMESAENRRSSWDRLQAKGHVLVDAARRNEDEKRKAVELSGPDI